MYKRQPLAGEVALVQPPQLSPRAPYDAPRWLRTDRPVRLLGEIVDLGALQAAGFSPAPIRIPFRLAPDLYAWRDRPLQLDLR